MKNFEWQQENENKLVMRKMCCQNVAVPKGTVPAFTITGTNKVQVMIFATIFVNKGLIVIGRV